MTTDRIKNNNKFIDNIITQEEWEKEYNKNINNIFIKYGDKLLNYTLINKNEIDYLKTGGYIKYINNLEDLIFGGILININSNFITTKKDDEFIKINKNNMIFYRNHRTLNDKTREIFITSMDKYK